MSAGKKREMIELVRCALYVSQRAIKFFSAHADVNKAVVAPYSDE